MYISADSPPLCYIIGNGSFLIQCAESLLNNNMQILGIISSDNAVCVWANRHHIPLFDIKDGLNSILAQQPFDYLFSINNADTISVDQLRMTGCLAINFHDAPLPEYAGVNTTSWGILNGEKTWSICWHVLEARINAGAILKQTRFAVEADETAFSLNGKCYGEGITAFSSLINELLNGQLQAIEQDLGRRRFYTAEQKPEYGAIIDWSRPAQEIDALVRGLDFGVYPNPIGMPKLSIGNTLYTVHSLKISQIDTTAKPGTLLEIAEDKLRISCLDAEVYIGKLKTLQGQPLVINELVAQHHLDSGLRLAGLQPETMALLNALQTKTARYEKFWLARLHRHQPLYFPALSSTQFIASPLASIPLAIPATVLEYVKTQGYSLRLVLESAFVIYLWRITGKPCFDLAYVPAGLTEMTTGMGNFFSQQLPWRINCRPEAMFADVYQDLAMVRQKLNHSLTYPLDLVGRHPDLAQQAGQDDFKSFAAIIESNPTAIQDNGLALVVPLEQYQPNSTFAAVYFDPARIAEPEAENIVGRLQAFLTNLAIAPQLSVAELPLQTEQERQKILKQWNTTDQPYPAHLCIHECFEAQVAATPDSIAVISGHQQLSYRDLNTRANRIARYLRTMGVCPDTRVAICAERGLNLIVGILAILKAGGAYVPLDPNYPHDRIEFMLRDSQPLVLLSETANNAVISGLSGTLPLVDIGAAASAWDDLDDANLPRSETGLKPENLAYIIYTSGSTGRPKGVMIEHRSLCNHIHYMRPYYEYLPIAENRILQFTSINFDVSAQEIFAALLSGSALVLLPPYWLPGADEFWNLCQEYQITVAVLPTLYWRKLVSEIDRQFPAPLRCIIIGGEAITPDALQNWFKQDARPRLISCYGPTETCINTAIFEPEINTNSAYMIGRPTANMRIYILDEHQQPVPTGMTGELYIAGIGVARGYLNRPDLTAQQFLPDPFSETADARLYKSGDLGRWQADGNIEFLGRNDHQVKIRGFRIELGEVESALLQHPDVREALVMTRTDEAGTQLIAYFCSSKNITTEILRQHLSSMLPEYMVPAVYVELATMPSTPNGKLDRNALPAPSSTSHAVDHYQMPAGETEILLEQIWCKLLKVDKVSRHDNFFELGGHSLMAISMLSKIERVFQFKLPVATVFHSPTLAEMAEVLNGQQQPSSFFSIVPVQKADSDPVIFWIEYFKGCYKVIRDLDLKLPVFGLRYGIGAAQSNNLSLPTSVEALAAHYLEQILLVQPIGPYHLVGHSFGGLVGFEIAQQLIRRGETVAWLCMIDTKPNNLASLHVSFKTKLANLRKAPFNQQCKQSSQWLLTLVKRLKYFFIHPVYDPYHFSPELINPLIKAYVIKEYPGRITFVKALISDSLTRPIQPFENGWRKICPSVDLYEIQGNHYSILEDGSQLLAKVISKTLKLGQKKPLSQLIPVMDDDEMA